MRLGVRRSFVPLLLAAAMLVTGSACNNTAGYNLPYLGCLCCSKAAADNAFCYCIANGGAFAACFAVQCKDYTASYTKCFSF